MTIRAGGRFVFLEPFDGGSHGRFARGLIANSRLAIDFFSLPARFWKWRMRGAALHFARAVAAPEKYAGMLVSGLMSLADLKAIWGAKCPPALVYFHETQLAYPRRQRLARDAHFAFTDLTTALCARRVLFNSEYHRRRFLELLPPFLARLPDFSPLWAVETIAAKAAVARPGCDFPDNLSCPAPANGPPLIIWNHRWEHDKNPAAFFRALEYLEKEGLDFRLALLGERFARIPAEFVRALERFATRIVSRDFLPDRRQYYRLLSQGQVVVSTAWQENFGLAVVEAVRCGCWPVLPRRLVYPEIIPRPFHEPVFYRRDQDLGSKLASVIRNLDGLYQARIELAAAMAGHAWSRRIGSFDRELAALAEGGSS